jgi:hypothetical protein
MYLPIHFYFLLSITIQVDLAIVALNEAWHLLVPMELGRKQNIFKILMVSDKENKWHVVVCQ